MLNLPLSLIVRGVITPSLLSAGRTDLQVLRGDGLDKSLTLGHQQASLHGSRSIAVFTVFSTVEISFNPSIFKKM